MEGIKRQMLNVERPIEKPEQPLPVIYRPSELAEQPTKRRHEQGRVNERAHFFVKEFDENGRPVYGFVITREPADHKAGN
jgi:hypothetical protein